LTIDDNTGIIAIIQLKGILAGVLEVTFVQHAVPGHKKGNVVSLPAAGLWHFYFL
jgi:hypothetical protein